MFVLNFPFKAAFVLAGGVVATPGTLSPLDTAIRQARHFETTFLRERLWKGGGRVTLLEGPGLGVEVDEAYVREHAVPVRMP